MFSESAGKDNEFFCSRIESVRNESANTFRSMCKESMASESVRSESTVSVSRCKMLSACAGIGRCCIGFGRSILNCMGTEYLQRTVIPCICSVL